MKGWVEEVTQVPMMGEEINKLWWIPTMKCYSAWKKDILTHVTTWTDREVIMLSEISPSQKEKYCLSPLIGGNYSLQIHWDRKQEGCFQGSGRRWEWEAFGKLQVLLSSPSLTLPWLVQSQALCVYQSSPGDPHVQPEFTRPDDAQQPSGPGDHV